MSKKYEKTSAHWDLLIACICEFGFGVFSHSAPHYLTISVRMCYCNPPKQEEDAYIQRKANTQTLRSTCSTGGKTDVKLRTNPLICKTLILILQKLFPLHLPHSTRPFHLLLLSTFNFPLCRDAAVCYYKTTNRLVTNSCQVLV